MKHLRTQPMWKCVAVLIPVIFFVYCGWMYFAIGGHWSVSYDFSFDPEFAITDFSPSGRALARTKNLDNGQTSQQIVGEPVYMTVRPPRTFDRVIASIDLSSSRQSIASIGVITRLEPYTVQLQPLLSTVVDEARDAGWTTLTQGGTTVLQRESWIHNVSDIDGLPASVRIATYGTTLPAQPISALANDSGIDAPFTIPVSLLGVHDIALFLHAGTQAHIMTSVRSLSSDTAAQIQLSDMQNTVVGEATRTGDEYVLDSAILTTGVYRLRIAASQDVIFDNLLLPTNRAVSRRWFVYAVPHNEDIPQLVSTGKRITLAAVATEGFGEQQVNDTLVSLSVLNAPVVTYAERLPATVALGSVGVMVMSNGYTAFSEHALFDPEGRIHALDETTRLSDVDVLVIGQYPDVEEYAQYNRYSADINLRQVAGDRREILFTLAAPGIAEHSGSIRINHVRYDFYTDPLWVKITRKLRTLWKGN